MKDEDFKQSVPGKDVRRGRLYTGDDDGAFFGMNGVITTTEKKKRRFCDEQIKSLELMFESETRLEPRKKLEVAKELGLHPRQVAIWFQNKRARSKSKQLEHDYTILQANYNILASKLESVQKEKQALLIQLQKLNDLVKKPKEEGQCCQQVTTMDSNEHGLGGVSDDDSATKMEYFGLEEEHKLISMLEEPADGSLTSSENWRSFESDSLFDQCSSSYPWWDFWS